MNRFIYFISRSITLLLCAFSVTSIRAQINLNSEKAFANEIISLGNISEGAVVNAIGGGAGALSGRYYSRMSELKLYCRIFHEDLTLGLLVKTSNSFDDDMEVALGRDFDETNKSLQSILDWFDSNPNGSSISFDDIQGRHILLNKVPYSMEIKVINDIDHKIIVDNVFLKKGYIQRAQSLLNNENLRKISTKLISLGLSKHPFIEQNFPYITKYDFWLSSSLNDLQSKEKQIKKDIRISKKTRGDESLDDLTKQLLTVEHEQTIITFNNTNLSYYSELGKEDLIKSVIEIIENELLSPNFSRPIIESGLHALFNYELKYCYLSQENKEKVISLSQQYDNLRNNLE